jgi:uncharacterized protein (DUF58 family)
VARGPRLNRPELTRRGWTLAGAIPGLVVASRVLGADGLAALAMGGAIALGAAALWVLRRRVHLEVDRVVPTRLSAGQHGRVMLRSVTTAATPWISLTESVDGGRRAARFVMVPLAAGTEVEAGYRIPTERRGRHVVGPTLLTLADPCGLVRRSWIVAGATEILVRPRVFDVGAPHRGGGGEPAERASGPRIPVVEALGEFLALRDYEPGDDPRRVHWRSTARRGDLLVRVDEAPAPGRVVILFDTRDAVHDEASFEVAVEAVASIAASLDRGHQPPEVVTSAGERMRRPGSGALDAVLDRLAVVEPSATDHLGPVTAALRSRLGVGGVVVVTGAPDRAVVDAAAALRGRRVVTIVASGPSTVATGAIPLVDASARPFPAAWSAGLRLPSRWQHASFGSRSRSPR